MDFQDYKAQVKADAIEYIDEDADYIREEGKDWDDIFDALFVADSVTGNGSGSYTFNSYQARENIMGLVYDSDFIEAAHSMGDNIPSFEDEPETIDVYARIYALEEVAGDIEDYFNEKFSDDEDDEEEEEE